MARGGYRRDRRTAASAAAAAATAATAALSRPGRRTANCAFAAPGRVGPAAPQVPAGAGAEAPGVQTPNVAVEPGLSHTAKAMAGLLLVATGGRGSAVARRAAEEDPLVAEARAAAEAAKLELEAAKLRAEAQELERANALERRGSRAGALLSGAANEDGTYSLSMEDLPAKLKEVADVDLTEYEVERLAAACGLQGPGPRKFTYEQLASASFDEELERIQIEARQAQVKRQQEEREAAQAAQQSGDQPSSGMGGATAEAVPQDVNDDRSMNSRVAAALAYILPLADSIQFGLVFLQVAPFLSPVFALLAVPGMIINVIPFGSLILFAAWVFLGANRDFPRIVRFNLQQAVLLDVVFFVPNLLVAAFNGGNLPPEVAGLFFLALLIVMIYCVVRSFDGELSDGIPLLSDGAKRLMDPSLGFGGNEPPNQ